MQFLTMFPPSNGHNTPATRSEAENPALGERVAGDLIALLRSLLLPPRTVPLQRVTAEGAALSWGWMTRPPTVLPLMCLKLPFFIPLLRSLVTGPEGR